MKHVIYYSRKDGDGNTRKHYIIQPGMYCSDVDIARKFESKEDAELFIENKLTDHWHIAEPYVTEATFSGLGMGTF